MKIDRARLLEGLRALGRDEQVDAARARLPTLVDTDRDGATLAELGIDVDEVVDHLGRGGLGKMIGG